MAALIRILPVDDQRLMREGLRILLELEPDLKVVGEAGYGWHGGHLAAARTLARGPGADLDYL
jgi:DNA-binding NarL/FixJ family response regulator